jgi:hypothetical protein
MVCRPKFTIYAPKDPALKDWCSDTSLSGFPIKSKPSVLDRDGTVEAVAILKEKDSSLAGATSNKWRAIISGPCSCLLGFPLPELYVSLEEGIAWPSIKGRIVTALKLGSFWRIEIDPLKTIEGV